MADPLTPALLAALHCLGFDHRLLTARYGGRDMRLTDVHGRVMREWLA